MIIAAGKFLPPFHGLHVVQLFEYSCMQTVEKFAHQTRTIEAPKLAANKMKTAIAEDRQTLAKKIIIFQHAYS